MALPAKTSSRPSTLAQRVASALGRPAPAPHAPPRSTCLLLDVSGSMAEECEPGRNKITALREIVATLRCEHVYAFADSPQRCQATHIPAPSGQTMMSLAFSRVKRDRHTAVVLITDGIPSEPEADVLRAAAGLRIEIFYVGPAPKPDLLDRLARAGKGTAHQTSLRRDAAPQLQTRIRGLLA